MITADLRNRFRFFLDNAGYCTPPGRAACALSLARAEITAEERGWEVSWEDDEYPDLSWLEPGETVNEVLCAALHNSSGEILASLCGITDPDRAYTRLVEAELADEALAAEESRWGQTVHSSSPEKAAA